MINRSEGNGWQMIAVFHMSPRTWWGFPSGMPRPVDIFPHFHILRGVLNEIATERRSHETSNALKEGQQEKGPEQPVVQRPGTGLSTLEKRCFHAEFQNVLAVFPCSMFINFPVQRARPYQAILAEIMGLLCISSSVQQEPVRFTAAVEHGGTGGQAARQDLQRLKP